MSKKYQAASFTVFCLGNGENNHFFGAHSENK